MPDTRISELPPKGAIQTPRDVELAMHLYDVLGLDLRPSEVRRLRAVMLEIDRGAERGPAISARAVEHIRWIANMAYNLRQGPSSNLTAEEEWKRCYEFIRIIGTELGITTV